MFRNELALCIVAALGLSGCSQRSDDALLKNRPVGTALPAGSPDTRVYDVRDIVEREVRGRRDASGHPAEKEPRGDRVGATGEQDRQQRTQDLCHLIKELIEPGTWEPEGTVGSLDIWNERIIVRHTSVVHRKLTDVFRQVRELDDSAGSLETKFRLAVKRLPELPGTVQTLPADWPMMNPRDTYFLSSTRDYPNDRPQFIEFWAMGQLTTRLSFHENGHLKSEEQFSDDRIRSARYYDETGKLLKKIWRPSWSSFVSTRPASEPAAGGPMTATSTPAEEPNLQVAVASTFISTNAAVNRLVEVKDVIKGKPSKPRSGASSARAARIDKSLRTWLEEEAGLTPAGVADEDSIPSAAGQPREVSFLTGAQTDAFIQRACAEQGAAVTDAPRLTIFTGQEAWLSIGQTTVFMGKNKPGTGTFPGYQKGISLFVTPIVSKDRRGVTLAVTASTGAMDGDTQFVEASATIREAVPDRETLLIRMPVTRYRTIGARHESVPDRHTATTEIIGRPVGTPPGCEGAVYLLLTPTIIVQEIGNEQFPRLMSRPK